MPSWCQTVKLSPLENGVAAPRERQWACGNGQYVHHLRPILKPLRQKHVEEVLLGCIKL